MTYIQKKKPAPSYTVFSGQPENYPYVSIIGCAFTRWGAHRIVRKYERGHFDVKIIWRKNDKPAAG